MSVSPCWDIYFLWGPAGSLLVGVLAGVGGLVSNCFLGVLGVRRFEGVWVPSLRLF